MRLLVTGGLGFIGSNFIRLRLQNRPEERICNLDKITYAGNLENVKDVAAAFSSRYEFEKGDIADSDLVAKIFDRFRPEAVVHFAAESHVDRSLLNSEDFLRTNVEGTRVLLEASRRAGVSRFIQISSDEVYGSLGPEGFFTETTPLAPRNPYAASKAAADLLALAYHRTYQIPVLITRCGNNYGPYQFPEKLIPFALLNLLEEKPVSVYGDGKNIRDWIHVEDHCRAVETILEKGNPGEIYNVGAENEVANLNLVKILLDLLQKPPSLIRFVKDRPGHDRRYATDPSKLKALGWAPKIAFEEGLQKTVDWYVDHRDWLNHFSRSDFREYLQTQYASGSAP